MSESIVGTLLLVLNLLFSYQGFRDRQYFEKYKFHIDSILIDKEYYRMISSGFLHVSWIHLAFNMIALTSFAPIVEIFFGVPVFVLIYFTCLIGGNLLALFLHKNHGDYSAVGASGAISGVVFCSIILFPYGDIRFILIPIDFPAWFFGVAFVLGSIYGIKNKIGNIGHDAHLGGALMGILFTALYYPNVVIANWWIVLLLFVPTVLFLYLIVNNPAVLMIENYWGETLSKKNYQNPFKDKFNTKKPHHQSDEVPNFAPRTNEEELNNLLDKIRKSGFKSLSNSERKRLKDLRDKL